MSRRRSAPTVIEYPTKEDTMATTPEPAKRTGAVQGELWSERAGDWSETQEAYMRPVYEAGLSALGVDGTTRLLDAGCGAGLALAIAHERGAAVSARRRPRRTRRCARSG